MQTYNIESTITVNKDWSRDEVLGKIQVALAGVGTVDSLRAVIAFKEDGSELNREMQIASGAIVRGKLRKQDLETRQKGYSEKTMKTRAGH
jgi:hypothetical protein